MFPLQGQCYGVNGHGIGPLKIAVGILKKALAESAILNLAQATGNDKAPFKVHMHIGHAGCHGSLT